MTQHVPISGSIRIPDETHELTGRCPRCNSDQRVWTDTWAFHVHTIEKEFTCTNCLLCYCEHEANTCVHEWRIAPRRGTSHVGNPIEECIKCDVGREAKP